MSRVGKKPIEIPANVQITIENGTLAAKGSLGELSVQYPANNFLIKQDGQMLTVEVSSQKFKSSALWGLYRSLIANVVQGVSQGYSKKLEIQGVGYRAEVKGKELVLNLGYSHPVIVDIPDGIKIEVEKANIIISGIDKQKVGQIAADIRSKRKPEPYKGKGIRYEGEHVRRKQGKRAAAAA